MTDTPLYELQGEALAQNRLKAFYTDASDREARLRIDDPQNKVGSSEAFAEADYYYHVQADGRDSNGAPLYPLIRGATDNVIAYAQQGLPDAEMEVEPRYDERFYNADIVALRVKEADETGRRLNRLMAQDFTRSDWNDLRDKVTKDAGIFGVGYVVAERPGTLDMRDPQVRALLDDPAGILRDPAKTRLLELLRDRHILKRVDPRTIYWQAGVRSALQSDAGQEMLRVSKLESFKTHTLQKQYPEEAGFAPIMPGGPRYGLYSGPFGNSSGRSGAEAETGVLETWEICVYATEREHRQEGLGPDGMPMTQVLKTQQLERKMVYTKIAGAVLVEHKVWDAKEGPVCLPVVPCYLLENLNHPYGYSLPMRLKKLQDFINRVRTLIFEHGVKSFSNQAVAMITSRLSANDDYEEIERKFRQGGIVPLELSDESASQIRSINEIMMPLATATANLTPALIELLRIALDEFNSSAEMVDMQAMSRARTAVAKDRQQSLADRPKTIMLGNQSRSMEAVAEVNCEQWRRIKGVQAIPVRGGYVVLNERMPVQVRRTDETGMPVVVPPDLYAMAVQQDTPMTEQAELLDTEEAVYGDTTMAWKAKAESRSWLPTDPLTRLNVMAAFLQTGAITQTTFRKKVLPEEMRIEDDRDREEAAEMQQQQLEEQMAMLQQEAGQALGQSRQALGQEMGATPQQADALQLLLAPELLQQGLDQYAPPA